MNNMLTRKSGLKVSTLKEGSGQAPKKGQTVLMHYEIWLGEGTTSSNYDYEKEEYLDELYDSTYDERSPFSGPIEITIGYETPKDEIYSKGQSIPGIDEALLTMREGEKVSLLIPANLAYGEEGASSFHTFHGYRTPPGQPIRCNIELVEIKDRQKTKTNTKKIDSQPENVAYEG